MPPDYGRHKQKDLAVFKCNFENMLKLNLAVYPMERDHMLFANRYLIGNDAATWEQYYAQHPEAEYTWAAMSEHFYSRVAMTKYCTDAAFQRLRSAKQGLY
jgi:hypothetical protein